MLADPDAYGFDGTLPDGSTLTFEQRTGWSGDGAPQPGTLRMFAIGAASGNRSNDGRDVASRRQGTRIPRNLAAMSESPHFRRM